MGIGIVLGILFIVLIIIAVYKTVIKKKPVDQGYSPFDAATRGIDDNISPNPLKEPETYIEPRTEQPHKRPSIQLKDEDKK